ncbi:MAG TPA: PilZ domain-containing protein [Candidatus Didemnitutus sp.]|nr:PilZ domain-containing protein [Candidatus Didemnitutus sp.]
MLFFKRILNFKPGALGKLSDKRKSPRYAVGPNFPLRAAITLSGGGNKANQSAGRDWAGRLANISRNGVNIELHPAALTSPGEKSTLKLALANVKLDVPCRVVHFRVYSNYATCGLELTLDGGKMEKAYLQLLEAIAIGASFAPATAAAFKRAPSGMVAEQFRSEDKAQLFAWRDANSKKIDSFEMVMGEYCVRGDAKSPQLEAYARKSPPSGKTALSDSTYSLSPSVSEEVVQLFRWVIPNVSKAVPSDLRMFIHRFAT